MLSRHYYVYILASAPYGTLYVGVTNDLVRRVWEHRSDLVPGFSREFKTHTLVWFEAHADVYEAIRREKRIKKWNRDWKVNLIQAINPGWEDLYEALVS